MAASTIEWTGETWNPTTGCDRVSPGCDNCYALTMAGRLKAMGQAKYQRDGDPRTSGPGFGLTVHPDVLDVPLRRRKPTTYFVNSMSDLFHPEVPDDFIDRVFAAMALASQHTFQVLTKRPQRMVSWASYDFLNEHRGDLVASMAEHDSRAFLPKPVRWDSRMGLPHAFQRPSTRDYDRRVWPGWPLPNVWLGTSIESDRYAFRADHLRATPAAVRFLSLEPLLGPLTSLDLAGIHWVIVGAESGRGARPMDEGWAREIKDRCVEAGIPFFFKQKATPAGRKISLPELDGRTWAETPARAS